MIDREQNLRLGDARKLSQMMQGESVPSSGLSKQMAEELALRGFDLAASTMVAEENSNLKRRKCVIYLFSTAIWDTSLAG